VRGSGRYLVIVQPSLRVLCGQATGEDPVPELHRRARRRGGLGEPVIEGHPIDVIQSGRTGHASLMTRDTATPKVQDGGHRLPSDARTRGSLSWQGKLVDVAQAWTERDITGEGRVPKASPCLEVTGVRGGAVPVPWPVVDGADAHLGGAAREGITDQKHWGSLGCVHPLDH
jgi:hypothetical protein